MVSDKARRRRPQPGDRVALVRIGVQGTGLPRHRGQEGYPATGMLLARIPWAGTHLGLPLVLLDHPNPMGWGPDGRFWVVGLDQIDVVG